MTASGARRDALPGGGLGGIAPLPREFSAHPTLSRRQLGGGLVAVAVLAAALVAAPAAVVIALIGIVTAIYLATLAYRIGLYASSLSSPAILHVSDDAARAIPDHDLPVYTVLVPAYHEPELIGSLIERLGALEYPADRLDVKLLLEEDDPETIAAAMAARSGPHLQVVRVPPSQPRTKPKACNVGLASARGEYVTVYDVEDRPDPLQLRRAVVAFASVPGNVGCLQARLDYYNRTQNLLTRWFSVEYGMWFSELLPGLVARGAPVPLGGTSCHMRRSMLEGVGAWDPYNVTEDADLGIRLHRLGYRTLVFDGITHEEANSDFVNWVKQRSRWYKGYLQTWLVHMRQPIVLYRQLGLRGLVGFNLFVGGTPLLALLNPVFWILTFLWWVANPSFLSALYPAWLYYLGLASMVIGNAAYFYMWLVSARAFGAPTLVLAAALSPAYWAMMSIAAVKALVQLVTAPSFWEKTTHGLDLEAVPAEAAGEPLSVG